MKKGTIFGLLDNNFYSNFVEKLLNACWPALVTWQRTRPIPRDVMCPLVFCEKRPRCGQFH